MISFTVDDVKKAYATTGLEPCRGQFCSLDVTKVCPLTALTAARIGVQKLKENRSLIGGRWQTDQLGLTEDEFTGIYRAVDLSPGIPEFRVNKDEYRAGYRFGEQIRAAIFDQPKE